MYGKKLREIREKKEISQYKISQMLGFVKDVYGHFEREERIMPIKHLNYVCNYFDISIDYVFDLTDKENYSNIRKEIDVKLSGERLKKFRKDKNITQAKLANFLNTTQSNIVKYEKGQSIISTSFLYAISKKYFISADYLLGKID